MVNPFDEVVNTLQSFVTGLQQSLSQGVQGTFRDAIQLDLRETQIRLATAQGQQQLFETQIPIQDELTISTPITNNLTPILIIGAVILGASLLFRRGKK